MKNLTLTLAIGSLFLFFTSCKSYQEINVSKVEGFKINNISTDGVEAEIGLRIKNPNSFGFKIYRSTMDVAINGIPVGEAKLLKKVRVKASSDEIHYFKLKGDFSKVSLMDIPKVMNMVKNKSVEAKISGTLKAGNLFYKKRFPVNVTEKVKLDK